MKDSDKYKKLMDDLESTHPSLLVTSKDYSIEILNFINNRARTLNYYKDEGLLHDRAKKSNFSFVELVWIKMIFDLREIGISNDLIKKLKENLFEQIKKEVLYEASKEKLTELYALFKDLPKEDLENVKEKIENAFKKEAYFTQIQLSKLNTLLLISLEGKVPIEIHLFANGYVSYYANNKEIELEENPKTLPPAYGTYISISLAQIISYYLGKDYIDSLLHDTFFTEDELLILETIRNEKPKTISIDFDSNNFIEQINVTNVKKIHITQRLTEIILSKRYEVISITTDNGNIVKCTKTKKIRPKNKKTR